MIYLSYLYCGLSIFPPWLFIFCINHGKCDSRPHRPLHNTKSFSVNLERLMAINFIGSAGVARRSKNFRDLAGRCWNSM